MEYLKSIPDILYKYRDWKDEYHKKMIVENELFLASRKRFNDPFDSSIPYRYNDADLTPDNIFFKLREIEKRISPHLSEAQIIDRCYEIQKTERFTTGEYWKDNYEDYLAAVDARFGILSLTTKRDNLLMWSHYSNSHKGYCIGFDKKILFELLEGTLKRIDYTKEMPFIPLFDDGGIGANTILFAKSSEWEYEDEYRITKHFAADTVHKFPNEAVKEIILGLKLTEDEKDEILNIARSKYSHAKFHEATMNLSEFKLDISPIL
ncbi:DUF2971 domain-containing protein [Chryseobacterium indologenes]|uniref:DUF2971 domain-containing protein n=1 Tax=Chryseobacterium indologenes TaxID=253 RepID=A0A411DHC8_CHRID|nr:DUF2971 domain-containing protein [Chryseobacterium indologenes]